MTRRLHVWTAEARRGRGGARALAALAVLLAAAAAQDPAGGAVDLLVPAGAAPVVDGRIGDEEWRGAAAFDMQRGKDSFGRGRLRRSGRHLYVAYESSIPPLNLGMRLDFTDPVSGRSNLVIVTPLNPPRSPVVPFRQLVGRDAERLPASECDIRFDFRKSGAFGFELRMPLDLLEIGPTDKTYGFAFEVWTLDGDAAIAAWPQEQRAATAMSVPAAMRSEGAWGAADAGGLAAPPGSEGLALLEEAERPTEDGPFFASSAGWTNGRRRAAPLADLEKRAARVAAACPDLLSVHALLVQARLAQNNLEGALEALDAWDAAMETLPKFERHVLFRMQLLRDLGRYDEALKALDAYAKTVEDSVLLARERVVLEALREAWRLEQEMRKEEARRDDLPRVLLKTNRGEIVFELFEDDAPNGVANFIALVEAGSYDGTRFHWAEGGGLMVAGDPNSKDDDPHNDGFGGPGYMIESEPGRRSIFPMTVTYTDSRRERRTEGSAFGIHLAAAPSEDGVNTVLGRVISGEDVVRKLEYYDTLEKATVVRKRPHPHPPVKRVLGTG